MAFNFSKNNKHQSFTEQDVLRAELVANKIVPSNNDGYCLTVGDDILSVKTLKECSEHVKNGTHELKKHLLELWNRLSEVVKEIIPMKGMNVSSSFENVYFLAYAKKSFFLSVGFSELKNISDLLHQMFDIDLKRIDAKLVKKFNFIALRVFLTHKLVMGELYREKLIRRAMSHIKLAQISGPWANVDIPLKERVWTWREEEENFRETQNEKRESSMYNPEYVEPFGFYYVEKSYDREPYRYEDMMEEDNYSHSSHGVIP